MNILFGSVWGSTTVKQFKNEAHYVPISSANNAKSGFTSLIFTVVIDQIIFQLLDKQIGTIKITVFLHHTECILHRVSTEISFIIFAFLVDRCDVGVITDFI